MLSPKSIAIVGASRKRTGPTGMLLDALASYPDAPPVTIVNPSGESIDGLPTFRTVADLPEPADLALLLVPAGATEQAARECADRGITNLAVFSAGFADDRDEAGPRRQAALARLRREAGVRILGPNSQGFLNLVEGIPATFSPAVMPSALARYFGGDETIALERARGNVAIITHSGGIGFALFNRGVARGVGFSYVISTGNEVDIELQDCLEFLLDDQHTKVVLMYVEGVHEPARFASLAARAQSIGKRLVIAKLGRSEAAARAALSHTGHLAGDDRAYDAVFRRYGVARAYDPDEMLDIASALSLCPPARGRGVGVVSASGGSAVWMADALAHAGLDIPLLQRETQQLVEKELPSFASVVNPVDITGAVAEGAAEILRTMTADPAIDIVVLATTIANVARLEGDRPALSALAAEGTIPTFVYSYTEPSVASRAVLRELGLPCFSSVVGCAHAVAALVRTSSPVVATPAVDSPEMTRALRRLGELQLRPGALCEYEAKGVLGELPEFGTVIPPERLATNGDEAVAAAEALGFPVALKVQSRAIAHKAAAGGVALTLVDADAVRAAYDRIVEAARAHLAGAGLDGEAPGAVDGVLVQSMARSGLELLVGVQNRSGLGPIVVVGYGGGLVEIIDRTTMFPAPFDAATAGELLAEIGVPRALGGSGGIDDRRLAPLHDLVAAVSRFAWAARDSVAELDLNPVIVDRATGNLTIVDALIA
jgi:acyl-CoA synthetase (NDP forming)